MPRAYRLEVYLHRDDKQVIGRVAAAINSLRPGYRVGCRRHGAAVVVTSYFRRWPTFFPQHGPGRKHLRDITLAPWQRVIVERHPRTSFVAALTPTAAVTAGSCISATTQPPRL